MKRLTSQSSITKRNTARTGSGDTALNRRAMIGMTAGSIAAARLSSAAEHRFAVDEVKTISTQPGLYCGWPTLTRRSDGQLLVVWSGGRDSHVCPFGRVDMMRSDDGGESWTWPRTVFDSATDDRDAGVLETTKGTLIVTTFTSLAYQPNYEQQVAARQTGEGSRWPDERFDRWTRIHRRLDDRERESELGQWAIRSTDGGLTWSPRLPTVVNSPHGPIQLSDGRLIYAGKELWTDQKRVGVAQSLDDGQSWQWLAEIPTRPDDQAKDYHELHAVECESGKLIAQIRNHNPMNHRETLQSESTDGGKTWTAPRSIGVWGLPSHLLRLRDGRLVMSYGHRRKPLGVQARVSEDEGETWSDAMPLWDRATSGDLGYPSTAQLDDGTLVTIWYEKMKDSSLAVLRQAKWTL
ncbi:sialidase family protein [Roseiconus lacunae]|uniref:sialidase family protein n=1 Tax=Roseiconus lacunae TaxID=2605694 RepID=UPI0030872727|nr:sialidase family protein [Stieleria sp. HD01]